MITHQILNFFVLYPSFKAESFFSLYFCFMSISSRIILNLFRLQKVQGHKRNIASTCAGFPGDEVLDKISFYLFTCNVSTASLVLTYDEIKQLPSPAIAEFINERGEKIYSHFDNAIPHQLFPLFTTENNIEHQKYSSGTYNVLAYDVSSLKNIKIPDIAVDEKKEHLNGIIVKITTVLFCIAAFTGVLFLVAPKPLILIIAVVSSIVNFFISLLLFFKENNVLDTVTKPFCSTENYLGCSRLLKSAFSKTAWHMSWAETGLLFFGTLFIFLLLPPVTPETLILVAGWIIMAVLISIFLILRMYRINVFCKLCLSIHFINILSLACLFFFMPSVSNYTYKISLGLAEKLISGVLLTGVIVFYLRFFVNKIRANREIDESFKSLKLALLNAELVQPFDEQFLQLKSAFAPINVLYDTTSAVKLSLILSLNCNYCAAMVNSILTNNLTSHLSEVELLVYYDEDDIESQLFLHQLYTISKNNNGKILPTLQTWYNGTYKRTVAVAEENSTDQQPGFCLLSGDLPYTALPCLFVNDRYFDKGFTAKDIPAIVFYAGKVYENSLA